FQHGIPPGGLYVLLNLLSIYPGEAQSVFCKTHAVINDRVLLVDGSLLHWYGVRTGMALTILPELFQ
nr:hypothetical protein [Anaerolineaceae bacterium]